MDWYTIGYALACVILPVAWGLLVVWASNRIDRRMVQHDRRRDRTRRSPPPIEYHI